MPTTTSPDMPEMPRGYNAGSPHTEVPNRGEHPNRKMGDYTNIHGMMHEGSYGARPFGQGNTPSGLFKDHSDDQLKEAHKNLQSSSMHEAPGGKDTRRLSQVREEMKMRGMS